MAGKRAGKAELIYGTSKNPDFFYATGLRVHDPIIFFKLRGKKYLVASDLEIDRAKRESRVDHILSFSKYAAIASKKGAQPSTADVIAAVLSEKGVREIVAHRDTSFSLADALRKKKFRVEAGEAPFFIERYSKSVDEIKKITDVQRVVFQAMRLARDVLAASKIKGNRLTYKGKLLTSDALRTMINVFLLEKGCAADDTIVASGSHAIDPHDIGSGPLYPHQSIIVDIFPKSIYTGYCGDATRTFCRGRAPDALKRMYATVKKGQELGISMVKAGINGRRIHSAITDYFTNEGYETGEKGGRMQGFFHGTGHGIGLEVHEEPARISKVDYTLKAGNVMSVEPGLYYRGIGGVRIEDLVCVTRGGCDVLSRFPKQLEIL
jgi:Xaa-Pro aminopeptidase